MASETKKRKVDDEKLIIDDLPNDVLNEIFKRLGMRLFIRCRLVSYFNEFVWLNCGHS